MANLAEINAAARAAAEPRGREIVRLRDVEGLNVRQIAERLGVTPGRISQLYARWSEPQEPQAGP